jgi:dTMP kinase
MSAPVFPGIFVTIEGVDYSGKSVLSKRLVETLNSPDNKEFMDKHNYAGAVYLREPGSTEMGEAVRPLFLNPAVPLTPMAEVHLLLACKAQLMEQHIRPLVQRGHIVICDRYTRTLLAYQGKLRGIPYQKIVNILAETGSLIPPNLEFFLNVSAETTTKRCEEDHKRRSSDFNAMDVVAFRMAQELREGYAEARLALPPYQSIEVDAESDLDNVHDFVVERLIKHLKFHRITGRTIPDPIPHFIPENEPQLIKPAGDAEEPNQELSDGNDPAPSGAGSRDLGVPDPA